MGRLASFAHHFERDELVMLLVRRQQLVGDQRVQILIEHLAFLVGELLESGKGVIKRLFAAEIDAELPKPRLECVATR